MTTNTRKPAENKFATGTIRKLTRGRNSMNGNPNFWVALELPGGEVRYYRTSTDAACAYGIENPEFRNTLVTLELEKNAIVHVTVATDSYITSNGETHNTSNDANGAK